MSGAKFDREGLDALLAAVRRHSCDAVVVFKLDRLGRSLVHLSQMIQEFERERVALICTSQAIDTSNENPAGRLQMHVLMAVAEFERSLIRERVNAGLKAAKSRGQVLGRPVTVGQAAKDAATVILTRTPGIRLKDMAAELDVSIGTACALRQATRRTP
jgi:DNA invertase Pin-like site-specific DNA recombinase